VSQAHLLGLFHRICKLLFYRIKPVFVFDGRPPQIKKDMIAKRRMKKSGASKKAEKTRHKIIDNYLKQQVFAFCKCTLKLHFGYMLFFCPGRREPTSTPDNRRQQGLGEGPGWTRQPPQPEKGTPGKGPF
jgi:hypothetical protein